MVCAYSIVIPCSRMIRWHTVHIPPRRIRIIYSCIVSSIHNVYVPEWVNVIDMPMHDITTNGDIN